MNLISLVTGGLLTTQGGVTGPATVYDNTIVEVNMEDYDIALEDELVVLYSVNAYSVVLSSNNFTVGLT